jgi:hypothetical protein
VGRVRGGDCLAAIVRKRSLMNVRTKVQVGAATVNLSASLNTFHRTMQFEVLLKLQHCMLAQRYDIQGIAERRK